MVLKKSENGTLGMFIGVKMVLNNAKYIILRCQMSFNFSLAIFRSAWYDCPTLTLSGDEATKQL